MIWKIHNMKINQLQKNISNEWTQGTLGDFLNRLEGGGTPSKENPDYWKGSIPWASVKDVVTHNPNNTQDHISELGLKNSSSRLVSKGTIIVPTRMALGHAVIFNVDVAINQDLKALYPKNDLLNQYLFYWFISKKEFIKKLGSGSTVSGIQQNELKKIKLNLPPLPEQNRIVSVLETWDKAIEKLAQKIEIKKQIKKGLTQDLLTGKKRLSGFKDKWKVVLLGDIGEFRTSSVDKKTIQNEKMAFLCNYMDVYKRKVIKSTDIFQKITAKESQFESSSLEIGDILFTPSSETPEDIGHSSVIQSTLPNLLFSYHLVRFRPNKNVLNILYSGYCFNQVSFRKYLSSVSAGVTRFTLSKPVFEKATINLPSIEEQKAISEILTIVDKQIMELEKKLSILKDQKKYLLNNLIAGTIRTPEKLSAPKK